MRKVTPRQARDLTMDPWHTARDLESAAFSSACNGHNPDQGDRVLVHDLYRGIAIRGALALLDRLGFRPVDLEDRNTRIAAQRLARTFYELQRSESIREPEVPGA